MSDFVLNFYDNLIDEYAPVVKRLFTSDNEKYRPITKKAHTAIDTLLGSSDLHSPTEFYDTLLLFGVKGRIPTHWWNYYIQEFRKLRIQSENSDYSDGFY